MISAESSPSSPAVWGPPAALAVLTGALLLGGQSVEDLLRYDRGLIAGGAWWLLLTANFVHLGWWHWFLNALSLALLVMLCPDRLSASEWIRRIVIIGFGMSLGLYLFSPGVATYVGLSGLIYGLFAIGLGRQVLEGDKIAMACCVFLACRVGYELVVGAPESEVRLVGGPILGESHLYGIISALIYGTVALQILRRRKPQQQLGGT